MRSTLLPMVALLLLVGCITKNPNGEGYITNQPAIDAASGYAHGINHAVPSPYSVPVDLLIDGVAGLVAGISVLFAKAKSNQAETHKAALNTIAAGVVKAGPAAVAAVSDAASNTPHFAAVADALNENTA